jgi:3-hydroxyisobutyrate dehydrogenase-like beta-hydroxyacid dehydrogenase
MATAGSSTIMRVGFIGLGRMGKPMSRHLAEAGHDLVLYDANAATATELAGAYQAGIAADCATIARQCDAVVLSLPGPAESAAVVLGSDGLLAAAPPGFLIVDTTTTTLEHSRDVAPRAAARQVDYLDAPVSRGGEGALTVMVGGAPAAYERARPLLEAMVDTVVFAGPSGAGTAMKLVNQAIYVTYMAAFAEGLALAEEFGVPLDAALTALGTAAAGDPLITTKYDEIRGLSDKNFAIASAVRYLDYTEAAFGTLAATKPILAAAASSLRNAVANGAGGGDLVVTRHRYVAPQRR